jgi:pyruvate formate lyase activating enzyme
LPLSRFSDPFPLLHLPGTIQPVCMKACIFDIKRFAVHDGPGIRTTVFFKGCPLNCRWCHNPEGISPEIERYAEKKEFDGVVLEKELIIGRWIGLEELMAEILKDRIYMEESGGGVTFSGGEPLLQHEAVFALLGKCREQHLHTTLDTSGQVSAGVIRQAAGMADLILYDLKTLDDKVHRKYIGASNKRVLDNLRIALGGKARVVVRIPLVSGFNDTAEDHQRLIDYLGGLKNLDQVDILPYHPFGTRKCERFHKKNRGNGFGTPPAEQIASLREGLANAGFQVNVGG